jgi:hypothetical protein
VTETAVLSGRWNGARKKDDGAWFFCLILPHPADLPLPESKVIRVLARYFGSLLGIVVIRMVDGA